MKVIQAGQSVDIGQSWTPGDDAVAAVYCCRWTWCITSLEGSGTMALTGPSTGRTACRPVRE
jgi:hypothetical protein